MADVGAVIQVLNRNTGLPRPMQLWKSTITMTAATGTFTSPEDLSGTVVEAWIDPTTLTASATVKVYDANDGLSTPRYVVDYTAPNPAVENRFIAKTCSRVCGQLTCDVAAATAGDSFDLYVFVDEQAGGNVPADPANSWVAYEDETGATSDDALVAAPGSGLCLYVTDIMVTNDSSAAITIQFEEDTGSAKTKKTGVIKVPASGGFVLNLRTPIKCTAGKDFGYTSTGTSNFSVFASGYTAA